VKRNDGAQARQPNCLGGIDSYHLSVRVWAAKRLAKQHAICWRPVGGELRFAGDFHSSIDACDRLSDDLQGWG
jgi:hypothetical protein